MVTQCCKCRMVKHGDHWVYVCDIIMHPEAYEISHGYCPKCYDDVKREMRIKREDQQCAGK